MQILALLVMLALATQASAQQPAKDPYALYMAKPGLQEPYQYCWKKICVSVDRKSCVDLTRRIAQHPEQFDPSYNPAADSCRPYQSNESIDR
jgi:hypothetical protein